VPRTADLEGSTSPVKKVTWEIPAGVSGSQEAF